MNKPVAMVIGAAWCGDSRRTMEFFRQNGIPFNWVDIELDPEAEALVLRLNRGQRVVPTVVFDDGTFLAEPTFGELTDKLRLRGWA